MSRTTEQRLSDAKKQLAALNPDAEIEYHVLHPSFGKTVGRAFLTIVGIAATIIATGSTGFAGAVILLAGTVGHSANEDRPTEVTYQCPIPIARTEKKEIKRNNNRMLPNDDYVVTHIKVSPNGECVVQFRQSPRTHESTGDGFMHVHSNQAVVIHVKKEHHPDFSGNIKKLRLIISSLEQKLREEREVMHKKLQMTM